jgi:hypothetical protein
MDVILGKQFTDFRNLQAYKNIEDFALLYIVFKDGTFADIFASELVLE